ncbi:MAG: flagellin, partial [Alphaproteobacteria bacterium]|nr:flagellin [Alphaproteobacteria bacterium]
ARTDQYLTGNNTITLRLQTMEQSVADAFDIASDLKSLLVNALNAENAAELPLNQSAQDMMNELSRALNAKLGDRYLFSGTATMTAPVDFTDPSFLSPPTVYPSNADTSYFQGNSTKLSAQVADDFDVSWGVTADEPGFEQLVRALHLTATASTSPTIDKLRLQEALVVVNQAIDNLPVIRSRIGSAQLSIEQASDSHNDIALYLDQSISDVKAVDIPLTVTKLTNDQVILEASFMTVSRLASLTLVNFMK